MADAVQDEGFAGNAAKGGTLRLNDLHVAFERRELAELVFRHGNAHLAARSDQDVHGKSSLENDCICVQLTKREDCGQRCISRFATGDLMCGRYSIYEPMNHYIEEIAPEEPVIAVSRPTVRAAEFRSGDHV